MPIDDVAQPARISALACFLPRLDRRVRKLVTSLHSRVQVLRERAGRLISDRPQCSGKDSGARRKKCLRKAAEPGELVSGAPHLARVQKYQRAISIEASQIR